MKETNNNELNNNLNNLYIQYKKLLKTEKRYNRFYGNLLKFYKYVYRLDVNYSPMYKLIDKIGEKTKNKYEQIKPYSINPFKRVRRAILKCISDKAYDKASNIERKFDFKSAESQLDFLYYKSNNGRLSYNDRVKIEKYNKRINKVKDIEDNLNTIKTDKNNLKKQIIESKKAMSIQR